MALINLPARRDKRKTMVKKGLKNKERHLGFGDVDPKDDEHGGGVCRGPHFLKISRNLVLSLKNRFDEGKHNK